MHKSFATCASQYSWSTVIENTSNGKEIWSRYGIQALTSISCYDDSCIDLLGNLCFPLTFFRTREQRCFFLLKPRQFSPPSIMFYFILPYLPLYINRPTFTHTMETKQKVKTWFICPAILGKSSLAAQS